VWFKSCSGFLIARLTYSIPISFYVGDLFLRDILISFLVAKNDEFRHMIFKYAQYAVYLEKSEIYEQENVRKWTLLGGEYQCVLGSGMGQVKGRLVLGVVFWYSLVGKRRKIGYF
jgi:hypothetical protein